MRPQLDPVFRKVVASWLAGLLLFMVSIHPIHADQFHNKPHALGTIAFTPDLTPIKVTITLQPTVPSNLQVRPSPLPHPSTPSATEDPQFASVTTSGSSESIGYDFVDGSDPPVWMIWMGDEVLFINPSDSSAIALLDAFRDEVNNIISANSALSTAKHDIGSTDLSIILESAGIASGGVTAILSCPTVPLTFWLAGGTGWACAAGITATVSSVGLLGITISDRKQVGQDRNEARTALDSATREARELFQALRQRSVP